MTFQNNIIINCKINIIKEQEQKITALRAAIEEGLNSGIVKNFDPDNYLKEIKAQYDEKL